MPILGVIASSFASAVASGPAFDSIATVTVASGGTSYIEFTSIPSTYKHLQLRATMMCGSVNNMFIQVGNGSIDTGGNYSWHQLYGDSTATLKSNGAGGQSFGYIGYNFSTPYPNSSIIDLMNYGATNRYKTWKALAGTEANGSGFIQLWSGNWRSNSAINTIRITPGAGTFSEFGSFALYGIKG